MTIWIFAPDYNPAMAGVVQLYRLSETLSKLGHDSKIMNFARIEPVEPQDIVVYPEVVTGNPVGAGRVVRYFLNREGLALNNPVMAGPNDFIVAFSPEFHDNPHAVLSLVDLPEMFNDLGTKPTLTRHIDCTYIGKGRHYFAHSRVIDNTILIPRDSPITRKGLADLLRQTRFLYTWDVMSLINTEAIMCDVWVIPMEFHPFRDDQISWPYVSLDREQLQIKPNYYELRQVYIDSLVRSNQEFEVQCQQVVDQMFRHFG